MYKVVHMSDKLRDAYIEALDRVNVSELARRTGRSRRTLQAYLAGEFQPSEDAARELAAYLRERARRDGEAADRLREAADEDPGSGASL